MATECMYEPSHLDLQSLLTHLPFFLNRNFFRYFFRICLTPLFNTMDSSTTQSGRVYLRNIGVKGLKTK